MNIKPGIDENKEFERLLFLVKQKSCTSFIIGIERDGERYFFKSNRAAKLIGYLYRTALKQEQPHSLPSKFLPFKDIEKYLNKQEENR